MLKVARSEVVLKEQLTKASRTNLSPRLIEVFVTGRVKTPGSISLPQGSTLNQAIALTGGTKFLKEKSSILDLIEKEPLTEECFRIILMLQLIHTRIQFWHQAILYVSETPS